MEYWHGLIALALVFPIVERLWPERRGQGFRRRQWLNDWAYLALNGHVLAIVLWPLLERTAAATRSALEQAFGSLPAPWLDGSPFGLQLLAYLLVSDFLQWCVHRLLHGVPWLWQFHKVHHSARPMDWIANFRFHWIEPLVYRSLLFVPLMILGADSRVLFYAAILGTAWGFYNHANLRGSLGPLGWVFNSPAMHLWHHDRSDEGGKSKNFGIVLSLWDHLFGSAFWPRDRAPQDLGYPGDEEMPANLFRQMAFPWARRAPTKTTPQPPAESTLR